MRVVRTPKLDYCRLFVLYQTEQLESTARAMVQPSRPWAVLLSPAETLFLVVESSSGK